MFKIFNYIVEISKSSSLKKKIFFTLMILLIYRLLVYLPVPFVDINAFYSAVFEWWTSWWWWIEFFAMLLGWSLEQFSIISVWLIPFINASIIMQLLSSVLPKLEELQEQWESWTIKIQQYTRYLTLPLAFLQSIWMVYFISSIIWSWVLNTWSFWIVLLSAFVLTVWTIALMWLWELITEKWVSNWISLIIFSSIVAWIWSTVYSTWLSVWNDYTKILLFMTFIVLVLIVLAVLLVRTKKEIPITYSRHWKVEETATLPIPLNPVWMIPIIFSIAFISFPYLLSTILVKSPATNNYVNEMAKRVEANLNIYTDSPSILTIIIYFMLIVWFTFFYTMIVFNPDKIADNIQNRWWFIPWIRPWKETSAYLNKILMHLCLWWWSWLWLIWIYSYIIWYLPFIKAATNEFWSIPVVVSWAWVIIIVWVVQELINKFNSELVMERYDRI